MCGLQSQDSCELYFKSLKILTVPCLYILEMAVFVKSNLNLFNPVINVRKQPVRKQYLNDLDKETCKTALFKINILGMSTTIYNCIPNHIKGLEKYEFKRQLTDMLIDKCYYSVKDFLNDS